MSSIKQRLTQLGSAAAVATALITQPLAAQASELLTPILQAALASVATRSDRKDRLPSQLILQPSGKTAVEFTGHRSHSSHSSHRSHYSGASSHSSHSSHYSSSPSTPAYKEPRAIPPTASPRPASTASPSPKQGLIDPNQYEVPPVQRPTQYDFTKADQRFDLVSVTRAVNGLVWARVLDRKTGQERKVRQFDAIDSFVVTSIDADDRTATIIDGGMKPVILSARTATKK